MTPQKANSYKYRERVRELSLVAGGECDGRYSGGYGKRAMGDSWRGIGPVMPFSNTRRKVLVKARGLGLGTVSRVGVRNARGPSPILPWLREPLVRFELQLAEQTVQGVVHHPHRKKSPVHPFCRGAPLLQNDVKKCRWKVVLLRGERYVVCGGMGRLGGSESWRLRGPRHIPHRSASFLNSSQNKKV